MIPSYLSHVIGAVLRGERPMDELEFYRAAVRGLRSVKC